MKIPLLEVHIVTSKTLDEIKANARAEGVTMERSFANTQIKMLLNRNARRGIRPITRKKDLKK